MSQAIFTLFQVKLDTDTKSLIMNFTPVLPKLIYYTHNKWFREEKRLSLQKEHFRQYNKQNKTNNQIVE